MQQPQDSARPAPGQQVITVTAFIHHNFGGVEKVFLPKRAMIKQFMPGVFELPGGHIEFGEDLVTGLKREIFEEIGQHIAVGDPFAAFTYINEIKGSHSLELIYFATFTGDIQTIEVKPEEHSTYRWFAESELGELPKDDETAAMHKAFALLRGQPINT